MITELIIGAVAGIILTILVLRNNPKLQDRLFNIAQRLEDKIEKETGKDI